MGRSRWKCSVLGGILLLLLSSVAQAEILYSLDLTTTTLPPDPTINGAIFSQSTVGGSGSGMFDPFVRLNSNASPVSGYNYNQGVVPVAADNLPANDSMTSLLRWNELGYTSIGNTG
jgi:hypothetical protein